jgi:hemoglobin
MNETPFGFMDTSYKAAGGIEGIAKLVEQFYLYMDSEPYASSLRAMHSEDLTIAKERLTWFISGWLGGPKLYHENIGNINIPNFHRQFPVTEVEANAWHECMTKAINDQPYTEEFKAYLIKQFRFPVDMVVKASNINNN